MKFNSWDNEKYPYSFMLFIARDDDEFELFFDKRDKLTPPMKECFNSQNCVYNISEKYSGSDELCLTIAFEKESDAILFKLKWS